jgi:ribonucleoside-diphosphate reductase alpha chain
VERDAFSNDVVVVTVPLSTKGAIQREKETAIELMNRAKSIYDHWISSSHRSGDNKHNVSLTVSYKPDEVEAITHWIIEHRDSFTGVSLLPFDGGTYTQTPFESITEEQYNEWITRYPSGIDLFSLNYAGIGDARKGELACAGGACEIY